MDSVWLDLSDEGMLELTQFSGKYPFFGPQYHVLMWAKKYKIRGFSQWTRQNWSIDTHIDEVNRKNKHLKMNESPV